MRSTSGCGVTGGLFRARALWSKQWTCKKKGCMNQGYRQEAAAAKKAADVQWMSWRFSYWVQYRTRYRERYSLQYNILYFEGWNVPSIQGTIWNSNLRNTMSELIFDIPLQSTVVIDISHHTPRKLQSQEGWKILQQNSRIWTVKKKSLAQLDAAQN